jgi:predicted GNAT family N-acyltransferase
MPFDCKRCSPEDCTLEEIEEFCQLIYLGGEVEPGALQSRVCAARQLVFMRHGDELIGTAAIKNPSESYKREVFGKSRSSKPPRVFPAELGWVVVAEQYRRRGLAKELVDQALRAAGSVPMFATSRADNEPMHRVLNRYGFITDGEQYMSNRGGYQLQLFLLNPPGVSLSTIGT